jgi:hypothetical protein
LGDQALVGDDKGNTYFIAVAGNEYVAYGIVADRYAPLAFNRARLTRWFGAAHFVSSTS